MVAAPWRPREDPLSDFWSTSEFDLSDDSFQEMLAVGAIRVVTDASLRSSILAYYRTARDMTGNAQRRGSYEENLTEVLAAAGVAQGDSLSFADLALMVSRDPQLAVAVRSARFEVEGQLFFFRIIDSSRVALESRLAEP